MLARICAFAFISQSSGKFLSGLFGTDVAANATTDYNPCGHGKYVKTPGVPGGTCECDLGWRASGPTDSVQFLLGVCDQFLCTSDAMCQHALQDENNTFANARCVVRGWNCACGWNQAWKNRWSGHENQNGKCMGVLYTFNVEGTQFLWWILKWLWKPMLFLAILSLPFGQTHVRCPHHRPEMYRAMHYAGLLQRLPGWNKDCDGHCTSDPTYTRNFTIWNDFAWTIYVIDAILWWYGFLTILWVLVLFSWSSIVWVMVAILFLASMVGVSFASCTGTQHGQGGECCDDDLCGFSDNCDCTWINNVQQVGADFDPCPCISSGADGLSADLVLWNVAGSGFAGFNSGGNPEPGCCNGCCPCNTDNLRAPFCVIGLCSPLALLVVKYPRMPANLWGGFVGRYILNTHPAAQARSCPYDGNSRWINFLAFRSVNDYHSYPDWRAHVWDLLQDGQSLSDYHSEFSGVGARSGNPNTPEMVGHVVIHRTEELIPTRHRIVSSSWTDYVQNKCWVCASTHPYWDVWEQCGHAFCTGCSIRMIEHRPKTMCCPLCRAGCSSVMRAPSGHNDPTLADRERARTLSFDPRASLLFVGHAPNIWDFDVGSLVLTHTLPEELQAYNHKLARVAKVNDDIDDEQVDCFFGAATPGFDGGHKMLSNRNLWLLPREDVEMLRARNGPMALTAQVAKMRTALALARRDLPDSRSEDGTGSLEQPLMNSMAEGNL